MGYQVHKNIRIYGGYRGRYFSGNRQHQGYRGPWLVSWPHAGGGFQLLGMRKLLTCPQKTVPHVKLEWWIEGRQGDQQEAVYPPGKRPTLRLSLSAICATLGPAKMLRYSVNICSLLAGPAVRFSAPVVPTAVGVEPTVSRRGESGYKAGLALSVHPGPSQALSWAVVVGPVAPPGEGNVA